MDLLKENQSYLLSNTGAVSTCRPGFPFRAPNTTASIAPTSASPEPLRSKNEHRPSISLWLAVLKNLSNSHPEELQAVLSGAKEGSLYLPEFGNAGIPIRFARGRLSLRSE
jgi:hypothetical protein